MNPRLLALLLLVPAVAFANGSQNSDSGSQNSDSGSRNSNSGDSSQNSGGSSEGSGKSSQDSGEGSKGTGASSETSAGTSEQTGGSSKDSGTQSDSSKNSGDNVSSQMVLVGSVLVVAGASIYLGWALLNLVARQFELQSVTMAAYLRENHALVARDVLEGQGVVLDGWYAALGLSAEEQALLRRSLDGTDEQTQMLSALDGIDTLDDARRFAASFVKLLHRALGEPRTRALFAAAADRLS